ncbi:MAG: alkaline phosphatase [Bacteroidales bacterium]|nr:alkaline phosphatase [Bacteroidales bacterium]
MKNRTYFTNPLIAAMLLVFVFIAASCQKTAQPEVKNIILLIGDGMGLAQVHAAMTLSKSPLNLERAQFIGLSKTHSASNYITDSGAGGTALSTGKKTKNKRIALDTAGNKLKTIVEYAEENHKATGIVVTSSLTHATPASFVAHQKSRNMEVEIARDFVKTEVDVLIGGGSKIFDSLKLSSVFSEKGYQVCYHIDSIDIDNTGNIACFAAENHMPPMSSGRADYLPRSVELALKKLTKNENGFFLMVEGSQIDWGGHGNDIEYVVSEVIDFDLAVGKAMDFADKNPGTLVIVTADHETGGLSITDGNLSKNHVETYFTSTDHTGIMVPVYTYGTGAAAFSEIMQNTGIFDKMMLAFGFEK